MPRIRQLADQYADKDFWTEIDRQSGAMGLKSNAKIGKAVDVTGACIGNYRKEPDKIQVRTMRKIVEVLKPNIPVLLRFLGYSEKEIRRFAQGYISQ